MLDEFLRRFGQGNQQPPNPPLAGSEPPTEAGRSIGSGFVIDPEGLIVTAEDLVAGAERVEVTLPDGRSLPAQIVGHDALTGIALLRVETDQQLAALAWGSSGDLGLGENPFSLGRVEDFGPTLSTGMLAARSADGTRFLIDDEPASALNGAPVLDDEGRVIAIRIGADETAQTGATLAVAADVARDVVNELASSGTVARAYLGVQIQPVTADIATSLGLEQVEGALVTEVQSDTPAAEAGLQDGDVILSLDGEMVSGPEALSGAVASRDPGTQLDLQVWRSEEVVDLTATLAALPSENAESDAAEETVAGVSVPELGLTLQPLTSDLREDWDLPEAANGVAVVGVEDPSRTDIQEGDLIVSVHRTAVEGVEDVQTAVEAAKTEGQSSVLLLVDRAGERTFVAVPLAQS